MKILITGGAGFIGSAVIRRVMAERPAHVVNVDKMTYAAHPKTLDGLREERRYQFEEVDICDRSELRRVLKEHQPDGIIHLAAESHVDRSIDSPGAFVETNVVGTYTLIDEANRYWRGLSSSRRPAFRFHHVSTDEVYGSLGAEGIFTEDSRYDPNSPYAASKAAADHLVRAWHRTFSLPVLVSNSSNNYGPYQYPEKLIPRSILSALHGQPIEVYGSGDNVRDWLFVEDHAEAIWSIYRRGRVGQTYNVAGGMEFSNLELVRAICGCLDERMPEAAPHEKLITFVKDRPGHDFRYALDAGKLERELGFRPRTQLASGLRKTVQWYVENKEWWQDIRASQYSGQRLGLSV